MVTFEFLYIYLYTDAAGSRPDYKLLFSRDKVNA